MRTSWNLGWYGWKGAGHIDRISKRAQIRSLKERRVLAHNELLYAANSEKFPKQFRETAPGEVFEIVKLAARATIHQNQD